MNKHPSLPVRTEVEWRHSIYRLLLTPDDSNGSLGIFEGVEAPNSGPPRHIHHKEDETFYILQGEVTFWLNGETLNTSAGDVVFVPRGAEHTFHVVGPEPARMLTIMTPGGFESFFIAMARENLQIPQDMEKIAEIGKSYNLEFTGPPLMG